MTVPIFWRNAQSSRPKIRVKKRNRQQVESFQWTDETGSKKYKRITPKLITDNRYLNGEQQIYYIEEIETRTLHVLPIDNSDYGKKSVFLFFL